VPGFSSQRLALPYLITVGCDLTGGRVEKQKENTGKEGGVGGGGGGGAGGGRRAGVCGMGGDRGGGA